MAKRTRSALQREKDLIEVARLDADGLPQIEIAEKLGCSQQQVSYDLGTLRKRLEADLKGEQSTNSRLKVARHKKRLEGEIRRAHLGWERSLEVEEVLHVAKESGRVKVVGGGKSGGPAEIMALPDVDRSWKSTKGQAGDAAFIRAAIDALKLIAELDGLIVHKHAGPDGKPLPTNERVIIYIPDNGRDRAEVALPETRK